MGWYEDLAPCSYFGDTATPTLKAVGWLERERHFEIGTVDREVYDRLVQLLREPWSPGVFMGFHDCEFCQYEPAHGSANLFIPGDGFLYVCPELITHYMNAHCYAPPQEFCQAVLACPPMRSMEYLKAVLANGARLLHSPRA
jgi:hypothetical protein